MDDTDKEMMDEISEEIKQRSAVEAPPPASASLRKESTTWSFVAQDWQRMKGRIHERWPLLSDNEIDDVEGNAERFVALIQEHYGVEQAAAQTQVDTWLEGLSRPGA